ncbi:hypothetical protein WI37_26190 [Burkholderia ubonensis]|nr:hypothetical protein WI37_26190 [Burkholderia ubonensis]
MLSGALAVLGAMLVNREDGICQSRAGRCQFCEHSQLFFARQACSWGRVVEGMIDFSPNFFKKCTYMNLAS